MGSSQATLFCYDTGTDVWIRAEFESSLTPEYIISNVLSSSSDELRPWQLKEDCDTIRAVVQEKPALVQVIKQCLNRFKPMASVQATVVNYSIVEPNGDAYNMRIAFCTNDVMFHNGILSEIPNSAVSPGLPFKQISYILRPNRFGLTSIAIYMKFDPAIRFLGGLYIPRFITIQIIHEAATHVMRRVAYCLWSQPEAEVLKPKREISGDEVEQIVRKTEMLLLDDMRQQQQGKDDTYIAPFKLPSQRPEETVREQKDAADDREQSPTKPIIFPLMFHTTSTSLLLDQTRDTDPTSLSSSSSSSRSLLSPSPNNSFNHTFPRIDTLLPSHNAGFSSKQTIAQRLLKHDIPAEAERLAKPNNFFTSIVGVLAHRKANQVCRLSSSSSRHSTHRNRPPTPA